MPLFEITESGLRRHSAEVFADLGLYERTDLQRKVRDDVEVLEDDLLVIGEEFGQWEDARRRIDLLAIDKAGQLVVIELKRTDDGGHMDLQALRYAVMVSSMGFDDVVNAYNSSWRKADPKPTRGLSSKPSSKPSPMRTVPRPSRRMCGSSWSRPTSGAS